MDFNAFLLSFGMKPGDFDRAEGPIEWTVDSSMRHGGIVTVVRKWMDGGFKESEEGVAKILRSCI